MPVVHFIQPDQSKQSVEIEAGKSIMHAAVQAGVPGIIAECGGSAMCGTCHVYVDETFQPRLKSIESVEEEILEAVPPNRQENSRLSCQVEMTDELDGIVVYVAAE